MSAFSFIAIFAKNPHDRAAFPELWVHCGNRLSIKEAVDLSVEWCSRIPRQVDAVSVWQWDSVMGWRHVRTEGGLETIQLSFAISAEPGQFLASAMADAIREMSRASELLQYPTVTESVALSRSSLQDHGDRA